MPPDSPPSTRRLRLEIAYDGATFEGWQSQARGNTVQDHLEKALGILSGADAGRIAVHGSGRTDAGVHARAQVAHADVPASALTLDRWTLALNAHLPPQIRVRKTQFAPAGFHARFSARGKIYEYRLWNSPVLDPFERGLAWHLPGSLDLTALRAAAAQFQGTHDFAAFAANRGKPPESTVRTIHRVRVTRRGALLTLRFEGNGFLYRMVRLMVGTSIRCSQGRATLESIQRALTAGAAGPKTTFCAPAEGLFLMRVLYSPPASAADATAAPAARTTSRRSTPQSAGTS